MSIGNISEEETAVNCAKSLYDIKRIIEDKLSEVPLRGILFVAVPQDEGHEVVIAGAGHSGECAYGALKILEADLNGTEDIVNEADTFFETP